MELYKVSLWSGLFILVMLVVRVVFLHSVPKGLLVFEWKIIFLRLLLPFSIPVAVFSGKTLVQNTGSNLSLGNADTLLSFMEAHAQIWFFIWIAGFVVLLLLLFLDYRRCSRLFQEALPLERDVLEELWIEDTARTVQLVVSDRVHMPMTFGIIKPRIVLPKTMDWTDIQSVRYILTHEQVHVEHRDNFWKLFGAVLVCMHWFNPAVWILYFILSRDLELWCDETVIGKMGEGCRIGYANSLVDYAQKTSRLQMFCSSYARKEMKERIIAIMNYRKGKLSFGLLAAACILSITMLAVPKVKAETQQSGQDDSVSAESRKETEVNYDETTKTIEPSGTEVQMVLTEEGVEAVENAADSVILSSTLESMEGTDAAGTSANTLIDAEENVQNVELRKSE